jgi:predicted TPR repeat methyltransferase
MAKATETSNSINAMTQTPGNAVLIALVRRLRERAAGIANAKARRTIGRDMIAAADVIEHWLATAPDDEAAASSTVAILGRSGFAAYVGGP